MYTREQAAQVASAWIQASEHPRQLRAEVVSPSFTIALSREPGSGGALVAREVGRRLNWPVYDNELLEKLASELSVDVRRLENVDEKPGSRLVECVEAFASGHAVTELTYFRRILKLILALGARGECLIVGRGAMIVLPPESTLRVRVIASRDDRVAAVARERQLAANEALRYVESRDRERSQFVRDHYHKDPADPLLFDLTLNASRLSIDECAGVVVQALQILQSRKAARSDRRAID